MPHLTNRSWKPEDIQRLTELAEQGATVARASAALKRSQSAVIGMSRKIGTSLLGVRELRARIKQANKND